jgi:hypothetical protein
MYLSVLSPSAPFSGTIDVPPRSLLDNRSGPDAPA